jgi:hypothetical protein
LRREFPRDVCDDLPHRLDAPAREFGRRQHAGPGVEDLHRIRAGAQLLDEIARRDRDQNVDHAGERLAFAISHQPGRGLIGRAAPRHHVGRDRPRRAAEAEQRDIRRQCALHLPHGLVHRRKHAFICVRCKRIELRRIVERLEPRPFAGFEGHRAAECMWHDQNVGEQNRGIEAEAPDRLQCGFGRQLGREAKIEETARALA